MGKRSLFLNSLMAFIILIGLGAYYVDTRANRQEPISNKKGDDGHYMCLGPDENWYAHGYKAFLGGGVYSGEAVAFICRDGQWLPLRDAQKD